MGGMRTIQEDGSGMPGPFHPQGTHMTLRNSSARGMYGHRNMSLSQPGSVEHYHPYNSSDGQMHSGFNCSGPGLSLAAGMPPSGPSMPPPRGSFNLFDSAAATGALGPRVAMPSRPASRHEAPVTQSVTLAPDDHSWSLTKANGGGVPPRPMPQHAHFQHAPPGHFGGFANPQQHAPLALQQQQLPLVWQAHGMAPAMSASLNNSPHSSNLSRQTPSPPVAPPGFIISSSAGPRQLLIMYTPPTHNDISGARPANPLASSLKMSWRVAIDATQCMH